MYKESVMRYCGLVARALEQRKRLSVPWQEFWAEVNSWWTTAITEERRIGAVNLGHDWLNRMQGYTNE